MWYVVCVLAFVVFEESFLIDKLTQCAVIIKVLKHDYCRKLIIILLLMLGMQHCKL